MTSFEYCVNCEFLSFGELKCKCSIGYNTKECPIAQSNKKWAEYDKAKAQLKAEIEKPFIKFLDWFENRLQARKKGDVE